MFVYISIARPLFYVNAHFGSFDNDKRSLYKTVEHFSRPFYKRASGITEYKITQ